MQAELIGLRVQYGVSATEALKSMPAWEYDLLVAALRPSDEASGDADGGDLAEVDFTSRPPPDPPVPAALRGL